MRVTGAVVLVLTLTDPGTLHCGTKNDEFGVTEQVSDTVPLKEPEGIITKLNVALFPAVIVCNVSVPCAGAMVKSQLVLPAVELSSTKTAFPVVFAGSPVLSARTRSGRLSPFMSAT